MKKAFLLVTILFVSVLSTACINNFAVQELNSKAKGYLAQGDYDNAISRLKSSIDLDSTIFETHYNLAIAYTQAEMFPEAVESFKRAMLLNPDFVDVYYSLAVSQENFAKGIIDGSFNIVDGEIESKTLNVKDSGQVVAEKKLTKEEKVKIVELLDASIKSYTAYLEKAEQPEDKEAVELKIEYLQKQADKYTKGI